MIKTKPATANYRNNFDNIFKKEKNMKRYKVPVDLYIYAKDAKEGEQQIQDFMKAAQRDLGPSYNLINYVFPVDYPTEEEPLGTTV